VYLNSFLYYPDVPLLFGPQFHNGREPPSGVSKVSLSGDKAGRLVKPIVPLLMELNLHALLGLVLR
jgi:hypothetical protein